MYFLKTDTVSGYLMTPVVTEALFYYHFSAHTTPTVLRNPLQHLLHFTQTSPMHAQTSFQSSLPKNDVPTYVWSYMHVTFLPLIYWIPNYFTLSLSRLTLCVKTVPLMSHTIIHTNALARFLTFSFQKGLKQISASTLTQSSRYRPFITNGF